MFVFMLSVGVGRCRRVDQGGRASDHQWHKDCVRVDQTDGYPAPSFQVGNKNSSPHFTVWGNTNETWFHFLVTFKQKQNNVQVITTSCVLFCFFCRSLSSWGPEWWRKVGFLSCWLSCWRLCSHVCRQLKNRKTSKHQSEYFGHLTNCIWCTA